jgi:c-di-GMP-binding flagellar brake protein YcgR
MKTSSQPPFQQCSFEQTQLQIGDRLQVELLSDPARTHYFTALIGHVPGVSVLIRTPAVRGEAVEVREGEGVLLRAFSGRSVYAFETTVLRTCPLPFPYLHLNYPKLVRANPIRGAERVRVGLKGTALNPEYDPEGIPVGCVVGDLSVTGAQLECPSKLAEKGGRLQIFFGFKLEPNGYEVKLTPEAEVQSVRTYRDGQTGDEMYSYGVRFGSMHATESLLLQSYIHQVLLSDRTRIA